MLTLSQHIDQILGILLALFLSSLIGLERQARGKSAGLRTDAIVGMTSALLMVVSKYGFNDVLAADLVRVDPSRVAAQIVSGIGFLGAGIILTRSGAVRGLTTAATVWETAGIGMACGAGLWIAGTAVTLMHFIVVFALTPLSRHIGPHAPRRPNTIVLELVFDPGQGVMRRVLSVMTDSKWRVSKVRSDTEGKRGHAFIETTTADRVALPALIATISDLPGIYSVEEADPHGAD